MAKLIKSSHKISVKAHCGRRIYYHRYRQLTDSTEQQVNDSPVAAIKNDESRSNLDRIRFPRSLVFVLDGFAAAWIRSAVANARPSHPPKGKPMMPLQNFSSSLSR